MAVLNQKIQNYIQKNTPMLVILTLLTISTSAMSYEYFLGAMASYLLGDGRIQWALTITAMMVSMGIGGYCSRYVIQHERMIVINELVIAFVGGFSTLILYALNVYMGFAQVVILGYISVNGFILGFQVPLFMHILRKAGESFGDLVARVTLFDFLGAVPAVILYVYLMKAVGLVQGTMLMGLINASVVILAMKLFETELSTRFRRVTKGLVAVIVLLLMLGLAFGERAVAGLEQQLYNDRIVYQEQSVFQHINLTKQGEDLRMFLNGNIQFSSIDEYRYHEALVHPAMSSTANREDVLILGGGDGLALREIFKYSDVKKVTLVDLDPAVVELSRTNPVISRLNQGSLDDPRVQVVNQDAYKFLEQASGLYGVIIIDLPDPNNESLAKLYTREFYTLVRRHLAKGGAVAVQSTSPYYANEAFWAIVNTVEAAGLDVVPYHTYVPSFGEWGFTLASDNAVDTSRVKVEVATRYLNQDMLPGMFVFPEDETESTDEVVNTLIHPVIIDLYQQAWENW